MYKISLLYGTYVKKILSVILPLGFCILLFTHPVLAAEGCTCVEQIQYIQRGYENFEEKIRSLGGIIERVDVEDRTDRDRMMRKMSLAAY